MTRTSIDCMGVLTAWELIDGKVLFVWELIDGLKSWSREFIDIKAFYDNRHQVYFTRIQEQLNKLLYMYYIIYNAYIEF